MTGLLSLKEIVRAVEGQLMFAPLHPIYAKNVSIDTRTLKPNDIFIAIKGNHLNGNDYVERAFTKGACCAIVSRIRWQHNPRRSDYELGPGPLVAVSDTKVALRKLASYWRRRLRATVLAVTGSVGKSTTREMIRGVLSQAGKTQASIRNYNNIYGVPLSILQIALSCEYVVLELGMSAPGEIAELADICQPSMGVVTNVITCHSEFFGSLNEIADAKAELFGKLPANGALFLNAEDQRLMARARIAKCSVETFGSSAGDYRAENIKVLGEDGIAFDSVHNGESFPIRCRLLGIHNVYSAQAAVAVGRYLGLSWEAIAQGILSVKPLPHRLNLLVSPKRRFRVLDDCYNASPGATRAAIDTLLAIRESVGSAEPVALVLADMLELGDHGEQEHYALGEYIASRNVDAIYLLGPLSAHTARGAKEAGMKSENVHHYEAIDQLRTGLRDASKMLWVLVKGSRRFLLERVVKKLCLQGRIDVPRWFDA
ncbi:UDP-N-acetylmuramoyl-tripeptide--D-alanyl-D-alanine ligase [bacterium]|nr:UDP-N-acetylmuramoyl-tripeptide--D-alanyl-D-alanine ligase [bacterium]